jgi:hypothetical protein
LTNKSKEKAFTVNGWKLCVPCNLSVDAIRWWEKWKKVKTERTGIAISLMCLTDIEQILMSPQARQILRTFNLDDRPNERFEERAIQSLPEEKAIAYDKSVFIKKLLVAGITETMAARHQFFNAEIMYREIHDKGDPEEITEYENLAQKIWTIWWPRFQKAIGSNNPVAETKQVCFDMHLAIEQMDKGTLDSPLILASIVHKLGVMHQLSDDCKLGWSPNFEEIGREV